LPDCLLNLSYKETAAVRHVTDGDTIVVEIDGDEYKLRYIGIDTPEVHPMIEYFGPQAAEKNRDLVAGKTLTLYRDQSETDDYGRLLRYVVADGVFINLLLVREGYADAKDYHPDTACSQVLRDAEESAREENLGMWNQNPE
jgi:micrococcal nuclease